MLEAVTQFMSEYGDLLVEGVLDTLVMTSIATVLAYVIGLSLIHI